MIASLTGRVARLTASAAVIDVGGFGLTALCTAGTLAGLRPGETAHLETSLIVREDSLTLFGFATEAERDCFELAQTATGVGPKLALAIMSVFTPSELRAAILAGNITALCRVPGVGQKSAQRLVIELKDKVNGLSDADAAARPGLSEQAWRDQVRSGLEGLGWSTRDAEAACDAVADLAGIDPQPGVAVLMRAALRSLAK